MAHSWKTATVAELQRAGILLVEDGNHGEYRPRSEEFDPEGVAFIRAADIDSGRVLFDRASKINDLARQRIRKGIGAPDDILLSHKGTVGKVAIVPDDAPPFVCSPQTTFWRCLNEQVLNRRYLYAFLRSRAFVSQLATRAGETDMAPYVSLTSQRAFEVAVPPLPEQRAIAHILGTLDDKIELNRRMSETLETMARSLFKSWFVDFDPVRAKAEGSDPGLPRCLADLFPSRLVDSDLGEIPQGWEAGTAADLSDLNPEAWTKESRPAEINYIDLSNTKRGRIEAITTFATAEAPSRARRVLRPGDTIVGTVRPGNGSYALVSQPELTGSTGFAVLRPQAAECAEFVYLAATAAGRIDTLAHLADGAAYPAVRPDVVAATPIVRPDSKVLARFSSAAGALLRSIAHSEKESRTLVALRDLLLPKLISGEIRLREAEKAVGAVA